MASSSLSEPAFSGCILLVYGIPGSGKTLLVDYLCSHSPWPMLPIHFDSFYPTDTRSVSPSDLRTVVLAPLTEYRVSRPQDGSETEAVGFQTKEARQAVVRCIEHLIELSVVGGKDSTLPQLWDTFTSYLQKYPHLLTSDRRGCVGLDTRNEKH